MAHVLLVGGTGLIGQSLSQVLTERGHQVLLLSRSKQTESPYPSYRWDIKSGYLEEAALRFTNQTQEQSPS